MILIDGQKVGKYVSALVMIDTKAGEDEDIAKKIQN